MTSRRVQKSSTTRAARAAMCAGFCAAMCLVVSAPAPAQTRNTPPTAAKPAPAPAPAPPQPLESAPPYDRQLLRLAEIMGALAWLTEVCGDRPGDQWRKQMTALMEAEAATQARRERLAGSYNRGFRGYAAMHRRCTPSAELIITRFLDEGGRIARDVANRFSG